MSLLGGLLAGLGTGLLSGLMGMRQNRENLEFQQDVLDTQRDMWQQEFDYTQEQNELTRTREDTAVQRRRADLEAAGINPILAAGQSASAGPGIKAPSGPNLKAKETRSGQVISDSIMQAIGVMRMSADISQTRAQTALTAAQAKKVDQEVAYKAEMNPLKLREQELKNMYDSDSLFYRLRLIRQEVENKGVDFWIKENQMNLSRLKVTQQEVINAREEIARQIDVNKLSESELNLLSQQLAIDTKQYNLSWYQQYGLPVSQSLAETLQLGAVGIQAMRDIRDRAETP